MNIRLLKTLIISIVLIESKGYSESDADRELNSISADLERRAFSVSHTVIRVKSDTSRVESEIRNVESTISSTQTRLNGIDNEITGMKIMTKKKLEEAAEYKKKGIQANTEKEEFITKRNTVLDSLPAIFKSIYKLERAISIENGKISNLDSLSKVITDLNSQNQTLSKNHQEFKKVSQKFIEENKKWLITFNNLVEQSVPNYFDIDDLDSFNREYREIVTFIKNIPSEESAIKSEDLLLDTLNQSIKMIDSQVSTSRKAIQNKGFSLVQKIKDTDSNKIQTKFLGSDEKLGEYRYELFRVKSLISRVKEKRAYLIHAVASFWIRLIQTRLHAVNVQDAQEIIAEAVNAINSDRIRFGIEASLKRKSKEITDLLRKKIAPRTSRQLAIESLGYLNKTREKILEMRLDSDFREDMLILIDTYKRSYETKVYQAQNAINDNAFAEERRRRVLLRVDQLGNQISTHCKELSINVLGSDLFTKLVEDNFLKFEEQCSL